MTPADLSAAVLAAARSVFDERGLDVALLPESTSVERPRQPEHGDYATTLALQLSRKAGVPPRELAMALAEKLGQRPGIRSVEIAGPGFLNIALDAAAAGEMARIVVTQGSAYGRGVGLAGQRINLEFVSANPTGPVHIGAVRWAAVGDALSRLLRADGAAVTTEYYFNDAGSQIDRFARSLLACSRGEQTPGDGYAGEYIAEIAANVVAKHPDAVSRPDDEAQEIFRHEGVALMFDEIRSSLAEFGVTFDVYFNEKDLHNRGELDAALVRLREMGHVFETDGATWLRTTDFGDDKDRVLRKRDSDWTYFAGDCAYYLDKRDRGFDRVVIMLGADHHGYVGRMRAMVACFGDDPDHTLEILIGQMVNLVRDGQPMRMSKRAGTVLTLADLVDAIGVDAARYALARYSVDSPIDIDLELWTRATADNPVYYVQYAHARIASLLRNAAELGLSLDAERDGTFGGADQRGTFGGADQRGTFGGADQRGTFDPSLLSHERENDLLKALGEFPAVVATAAELREPHRIARYLEALAGTYHRFYDACRVLPLPAELANAALPAELANAALPAELASVTLPAGPATDLTRARLWLVQASRVVFANGLALLGVSAPERM